MKTDSGMQRSRVIPVLCAMAFGLSSALASADPEATRPAATRAVATPPAASVRSLLSEPTILSPKGLSSDDIPAAYDDFLQRAVAQKRLELVRFVDRDDRRVFLGLSRDGYLGIQVQKRDRR